MGLRRQTTAIACSDHMIRREPAGVLGVARFDLQRRMGNPEPVIQFMADFVEQAIVEPGARADQMRRHGGFGGAHRPNVKIVDFADARKPEQIVLHA